MVKLQRLSVADALAFEYEGGGGVDAAAYASSLEIVNDVKKNGKAALLKHAVRLGDLQEESDKWTYSAAELKEAFDALPESQQGVLERCVERVRSFAQSQRDAIVDVDVKVPGGKAGHNVAAVEVAGCYAPGGRYPLPSSVIMTAVTARVAGVRDVCVASPRPQPATLAAAHAAGASSLLAIGGPHAIAALAYGIKDPATSEIIIGASDVIVGPGNKWVTAAKQIVSGRVKIDMLAGPSECLVLADATASPSVVAADLIAQAEHDVAALPILVTVDAALAGRVDDELERQLSALPSPNKETATEAVSKGFAVVTSTMEEARAVSDRFAPEHLEVFTANADEDAAQLNHYGGLFIGERSAEVFGDYAAGPNHVLPTGGTARYTGGLSVFTFLRVRTWLHIKDGDASQGIVEDAVTLARMEGLEGHARAAEKRLK